MHISNVSHVCSLFSSSISSVISSINTASKDTFQRREDLFQRFLSILCWLCSLPRFAGTARSPAGVTNLLELLQSTGHRRRSLLCLPPALLSPPARVFFCAWTAVFDSVKYLFPFLLACTAQITRCLFIQNHSFLTARRTKCCLLHSPLVPDRLHSLWAALKMATSTCIFQMAKISLLMETAFY